jgi:hypothetical protein
MGVSGDGLGGNEYWSSSLEQDNPMTTRPLLLLLLLVVSAPTISAGVLFKPNYPNAGLRGTWYVDSSSQDSCGRIDKRQNRILGRVLDARAQAIKQAWAGMYEDAVARSSRVGDATMDISLVVGADGRVRDLVMVRSTTEDARLLAMVRRRLSGMRLRRLHLATCIRILLHCEFRLDLNADGNRSKE